MTDIAKIAAEVEGRKNVLHANGGAAYAEACALYWPVLLAEIERLRAALRKIIEMNVQYARDRFGDESQAEYMACVRVAREALNEQKGDQG